MCKAAPLGITPLWAPLGTKLQFHVRYSWDFNCNSGCRGAIANGEKGPPPEPPCRGAYFSPLAVKEAYDEDVPDLVISRKCLNLAGLVQSPTVKSHLCRCSPSLNDWNSS